MSVRDFNASDCEICDCYSNSGFDLCEGCAMRFALWLHKKFLKKKLKLEDVEKQYEVFKNLNYEERMP